MGEQPLSDRMAWSGAPEQSDSVSDAIIEHIKRSKRCAPPITVGRSHRRGDRIAVVIEVEWRSLCEAQDHQ